MNTPSFNRRAFLQRTLALAVGAPIGLELSARNLLATESQPSTGKASALRRDAKVAIVSCRSYGPEVRPALAQSFDLLGGIGSLVKNKTVTVKLNLTGTDFSPFLGRPVGETYMTHYNTASALAATLFSAGATRVRFVESTQSKSTLETTLGWADWDVKAL